MNEPEQKNKTIPTATIYLYFKLNLCASVSATSEFVAE